MNLPGGWELILIVLVIMVLFGAKRLPDASRSLGRSMRIFKAETKGLRDDDTPDETTTVHTTTVHDTAPSPLSPPAPITPPAPVADQQPQQQRQP